MFKLRRKGGSAFNFDEVTKKVWLRKLNPNIR